MCFYCCISTCFNIDEKDHDDNIIVGTINNTEHKEIKSPRIEPSNKDYYLTTLCKEYKRCCKDEMEPAEFFNSKISDIPIMGEIVSLEDFLIKLWQ